MKTVNVRAEAHAQLKSVAASKKKKISEAVSEAIAMWLRENQTK